MLYRTFLIILFYISLDWTTFKIFGYALKHHYDIFTALLFPLLFILKEKKSFCYAFLFQQAKVLTLNAAEVV